MGRSTHLRGKNKGLHELPHGLTIVGQLSQDLHHHSVVEGGVSVHVSDFGVAFIELQGHDLLVDFLRDANGRKSTRAAHVVPQQNSL